MRFSIAAALLASVVAATASPAAVRVTEFMYQGFGGDDREFFEITNIGSSAVNVTGWSYNDSTAAEPVTFASLGLTSIGANESVVFTQMTAAAFRTYWGLAASVKVYSIGALSNLGNGDAINIYNSTTQNAGTLVDGISYAQGFNTRGISRNRPTGNGDAAVLGSAFVNATAGDVFGSRFAGVASASDLANPGSYPLAARVPEPASWAMMVGGFGLIGAGMRRRRTTIAFA